MPDSNLGEQMTTCCTVDENTVLFSRLLLHQNRSKPSLMVDGNSYGTSNSSQSIILTTNFSEVHVQEGACGGQSVELSDEDDYLGAEEHYVTASKQKVGEPSFVTNIDDIAEFNIDDTTELTMNKSTQTCVNEPSRNADQYENHGQRVAQAISSNRGRAQGRGNRARGSTQVYSRGTNITGAGRQRSRSVGSSAQVYVNTPTARQTANRRRDAPGYQHNKKRSPRRGMQPSFYKGSWGTPRGG